MPFPNRPEGAVYEGFHRQLRSRSVASEGFVLVRCANWLIGKHRRNIDRILENITFGISSAWAVWREGRPDVIIAETWPLFAAQFTTLLAKWWRVPHLYYVQDVYPEAAEDAGVLPSQGTVARICRAWDRHLCSQSAKVIVISETMQRLVLENRKLPAEKIAVVENWIDESEFTIGSRENTWRSSQRINENTFVAMFAGTLGRVSGIEVLVDVARILGSTEDILLMCIGEGACKQEMIDESTRLGLQNIRFLPFQPRECVPEVQASCDVALLTMRPNSSDASVPSKLISYLAASRPVICAANERSAVARTVLKARAGLVVPPGDAQAIAEAILRLKCEPETASQMRQDARAHFESYFTLNRAYRQFSDILRMAAQNEPE